LGEQDISADVISENPHKDLAMDFEVASETARDSKTFPGSFRVAADSIEIGRATSGEIPNIGAQGEAYLEMSQPDGSQLHIRGNRIRSNSGTVTVSGWPVVVRQGKRLVGTTKDTVVRIDASGVQALGPSVVEDLVTSGSDFDSDLITPLPSISSSDPFIPLPPDVELPANLISKTPEIPDAPKRRGIIDGKPLNRTAKRGFTGTFEGTENPKLPGDPSSAPTIDLSPAAVSTDLGIGNLPPLPTLPNE
jgi:hypothetical protein